jgi:hypothetical protein
MLRIGKLHKNNMNVLCDLIPDEPLLEKPPVVQSLKKFPTIYGTQRFITRIHKRLPLGPILR